MSSCTSSSRRFLLAVALSAGFAGALGLAASELLIRAKVAPADSFAKHVALFHASRNPNAAFGDSHVARGFTGKGRVVNLAFPSETIAQIEIKVRRYFADKRPGRVVLQADPHMFAPYRLVASDADYPAIFGRGPRPHPSDGAPLVLQSLTARHRPQILAYWHTYLFENPDFESNVRFNADGSLLSRDLLSAMPARRLRYEAAYRARLHRPYERFAGTELYRRYEAILDFLAQAGAEVCLVTFPVSAAYRGSVADDSTFEAARRSLAALARRHDFAYRNYWAAYDRDELFRDTDHLNEDGAEMFSARLIKECFDA